MHANAKQLPDQERNHISELQPVSSPDTLAAHVLRFMRLLRLAFWRAFQHDAFAIAKASAYSSILTFFPLLLVVGSVLATSHKTEAYLREISYAVGRILPAGSGTALAYLKGSAQRPVGVLISASLITLWTASGVMISWMEGFRRSYELPKIWGLLKERLIAFSLLVWMYMISLIILVGAEFNAMIFPRSRLGQELVAMASRTLTNGTSDRAR